MLTLKPHKDNVLLCYMRTGKKEVPIFWHPIVDKSLRNTVDDLGCFFGKEDFRDQFEISEEQSDIIKNSLITNDIPEKHQSKHFKIKKYIGECLVSEMDISDQNSTFEIRFPPDKQWAASEIICGGSGSGKTHYTVQRIISNLTGKPNNRRKFYYFSAEWNSDLTLQKLKEDRFKEFVTGIDCGEEAVEMSEYENAEQFFINEVKLRVDNADKSSVICFDDPSDMSFGMTHLVRNLQNRLMRVGRHRGLGLMFLTHNLRGGSWTAQCSNSCRYFTLFPRSQSAKVRDFIHRDLGLMLGEARRAVKIFKQTGRVMRVRMHSPNAIIGDKFLMLL